MGKLDRLKSNQEKSPKRDIPAKREPLQSEVAEFAAQDEGKMKDPMEILRNPDKYGEAAVLKAVEEDPAGALECAHLYKDRSYEEEIIEKAARGAAEKNPWAALAFSLVYKKCPYAEEVLAIATKKDLRAAFLFLGMYKDQPYAERIVEAAAKIAAEEKPVTALMCVNEFAIDRLYAKDVIRTAAKNVAKKSSTVALSLADMYKNQPCASEVLEMITERDPGAVLKSADIYVDQPYARTVLVKAAKGSPEAVLKFLHAHKNHPCAKELLEISAEYYPWNIDEISEETLAEILGTEKDAKEFAEKHEKRIEIADDYADLLEEPLSSEKAEELTKDKLIGALKLYKMSIPYNDFLGIFFIPSFQLFLDEHVGEIYFVNAFSIVNSVYRKLSKEGKSIDNDDNVEETLRTIWDKWEKAKNREIFGPNTQLILFTHDESRFLNEEIVENIYERSGGTPDNILCNEKGVKMEQMENIVKKRVLSAIRKSKGPTTILFEGHGLPEKWSLASDSEDIVGIPDYFLMKERSSINYQELGDALIESGNLENFNIIADTCFGYDYIENLFGYLEEKKIKERPAVCVSAANENTQAYGRGFSIWPLESGTNSFLLDGVYKESLDGKPIRVEDFFKAERHIWQYEDPSIKIGDEQIGYSEPQRYEEIAKGKYERSFFTG